MVHKRFLFLLLLLPCLAQGQSALLSHIFKPGIRAETVFIPDVGQSDHLDLFRSRASFILPVKSKFDVGFNFEELLKVRRWKDLLNVPKIKAYQIFANLSVRHAAVHYLPKDSSNFDPFPGKGYQHLYGVGAGLTGVHYLPKLRILLYTANIAFGEDFRGGVLPTIGVAAGIAKISKPWFYWYYALYLGFDNGRFLPVPILGGEIRFLNRFWLHVTLPVQMRLGIKLRKHTTLEMMASLWGYSSGFTFDTPPLLGKDRMSLTASHFKLGAMMTFKVSKQFRFSLEAGWAAARGLRFRSVPAAVTALYPNFQPEIKDAPYFGASIYYSFKKSLLDSNMGDILGN